MELDRPRFASPLFLPLSFFLGPTSFLSPTKPGLAQFRFIFHPELGFDDVSFRALNKCDDLMAFSLWHLKSVQRGVEMTQKRRPIGLADFHPFMGGLHVTSGVVHGTAGTRTQKINQELLFPLDPVLSSMLPETSQPRIRL